MTVALTTITAEAVGLEFKPTGDFALQVKSVAALAEVPRLVIDVEAAVDDVADWAHLFSWRLSERAIQRFAAQYRVRVRVRGNVDGNTVTVWRSA